MSLVPRTGAAIAAVLLSFAANSLPAGPAAAQGAAYPNRTITLVLPFAAGSGTDTTTRIISQHLGQALGVGIVIDNKPGANGMIAATYVARAAPDGYTLFVTTNTTHSANPYLLKTLSYDPVKDFTPIARTGDLPFMLVVHPDVPAKTVRRTGRLWQGQPGQADLCQRQFVGDRFRRHLRPQCRPRHVACALQKFAAGDERRDRRPHHHDVHRRADRLAACQRQGAARARRHHQRQIAAGARACRRCRNPASRISTSPRGRAISVPPGCRRTSSPGSTPKSARSSRNRRSRRSSPRWGWMRFGNAGGTRQLRRGSAGAVAKADQERRHRAAVARRGLISLRLGFDCALAHPRNHLNCGIVGTLMRGGGIEAALGMF